MGDNKVRLEKDALGNMIIPENAYYGPQTRRAYENFQISGQRLPRAFIKAQGIIKASSAAVNIELGDLPPDIGKAVIEAAQEVIDGKWDAHFVVDVFQAGAGTSQNMNANEIIARRATEILANGTEIHPNDHINMSQSSNDTIPSALNIAAAEMIKQRLLPAVDHLYRELNKKAQRFMPVLKAGRTHLHDGVPMRLGQEFSGYAETVKIACLNIEKDLDYFFEIGLGGNAVGTKLNIKPDYIPKVIKEVCDRTGLPFREPKNIFSFMQNMNAPLRCLLDLKELCIHLIKITSDLRLLSSGPRTGLAEINLPPVQPGSTIMPGKINPAILEMTHMVCCQVIGNEAAASIAGTGGQLEINQFMPLIAHSLLYSVDILTNAVDTLTVKCIGGIDANEMICKKWMNESLSLITGLSPLLGYDMASQIGLAADEENKSIKEVLAEKGILTDENIKAIDPYGMI